MAATKPIDAAWVDGGTAEVGIAPGYTIIENLDIKLELGLGLHSYNSYDVAIGGYGGLGASYAVWSHLYLGVAARNWILDVKNSNDNGTKDSYSDLRTTAYIGYRF